MPPIVNTDRASQQYYVDVLREVLSRLGWKNVVGPPAAGCNVVWSEDPVRKPRLLALPNGARTNRFFAMVRVCRKVCLAIVLDACERLHPEHFGCLAPRTWWVGRAGAWVEQLEAHSAYDAAHAGHGAYIVKPDNGCQGAGISLVRNHGELKALLASDNGPERAVVQTYLPNPLLVNGLKFDLRLYVVLTCASPLQAFLSTRGVARFASHAWKPVDASNQTDLFMHLSNSSINQAASGVSNKWELPRLWAQLAEGGADISALWASITRLVALTLVAMQPTVAHAYSTAFSVGFAPRRSKPPVAARRPSGDLPSSTVNAPASDAPIDAATPAAAADAAPTPAPARASAPTPTPARPSAPTPAPARGSPPGCHGWEEGECAPAQARRCFQIIGFDVMLDAHLKPWLLEVNHSPSMALEGNEPLEQEAKCSVITAALKLGLAESHSSQLCDECEVVPLSDIACKLCVLEPVRLLFEGAATSRSAQQWALNVSAFEKLVQPALPLLRDEKSDDGSGESNRVDLRRVFAEACAERADVGSGWDAAASGQMTLWAFTEAMLRLAARVRDAGSSTTTASSAALAPALERLVAACRA